MVESGENLEQVRILWREYGEFLKSCFHERSHLPAFEEYFRNYEQEIANFLPGSYGTDKGCLLLAVKDGKPAGCVGLRDVGGGICELKRLFVRPKYRGLGIGKALANAVIEHGRNLGYTSIRLDSNRRMAGAEKLYRSLGFKEISPYEHFDVDGMIFMEMKLV